MTTLREISESMRLIPREAYRPFPKWGESFSLREDFIARAEQIAERPILALPATRFMDFQRNGNRSRYETLVSESRNALMILTLAECQEGKGRFIDPIIDRIWAMCEETSWCLPAALNQYPTVDCTDYELPNIETYPYIDLSCGYWAAMLALILYLLEEPLKKESPILVRRAHLELEKRIFAAYMGTDRMWWMTLDTDRKPNNWNPWVNSNVLFAALLCDENPERREKIARKALVSVQKFVDAYPSDGGCDEGPDYFGAAGACLLDVCQIIDSARMDGGESALAIEKLPQIARYVMHMRIAAERYVNFADSAPIVYVPRGTLLRAARGTGLRDLENFALSCEEPASSVPGAFPFRQMTDLLSPEEALKEGESGEKGWYFASLQVCLARSQHMFFAAKGGHNEESHNHNDVGSYILYEEGRPVVIDVGPATYTRATFTQERWGIFCFRSDYHNTAIPSGALQLPGRQYASRDVEYVDDGETARFGLDMADAYPPESGAKRLFRRFELDRKQEKLTVRENYICKDVEIPILLADEPHLEAGRVRMGKISLRYDPRAFRARVEKVPLADGRHIACWKRTALYRLVLSRDEGGEWEYSYQYEA